MQISFTPLLYSNKINFNGNRDVELTQDNSIGALIHETCFFRESKTDDFVKEYVLKNFSDEPKIKIVTGACSSGEETYTQAMLYSDMRDKVEITGFDISPKAIKEAKSGLFTIERMTHPIYWQITNAYHDSFLIDNTGLLNYKQREQRELFEKFFEPIGREIYLTDKQSFYATKEIMNMCNFEVGDIKNLSKMYDENSIHVLTFKNALYHLVCIKQSSGSRILKKDAYETIEDIAKQAHKVLKPNGLFVFGEREQNQGIEPKVLYDVMTKNGFEPAIEMSKNAKKAKRCNVWKKV